MNINTDIVIKYWPVFPAVFVAGNWIGVSFFDKKGSAVVKPVMLLVLAVFLIRTILELAAG